MDRRTNACPYQQTIDQAQMDPLGWERQQFLHAANLACLASGLGALLSAVFFPVGRIALLIAGGVLLASCLLAFFLSRSGSAAARWLLPVSTNLLLQGFFLYQEILPGIRSVEPLITLALIGAPVLLFGLLINRWVALAGWLGNTALLAGVFWITGWQDGQPIALVLPAYWALLAFLVWQIDRALQRGYSRMEAPVHQPSTDALSEAYALTIEGWANALSLIHGESQEHARRVTNVSVQLAQRLGMEEKDLVRLRQGAMLHDLGKLAIPERILHKPGPLSEHEWEVMRKHPEVARQMLERIPYLQDSLDIPYYHHERWDGGGYPCGLKGEEIPLSARIFTVVEVWDALLSEQPYRAAWSTETVELYLLQQSGLRFDPQVVQAFLALLKESRDRPAVSVPAG